VLDGSSKIIKVLIFFSSILTSLISIANPSVIFEATGSEKIALIEPITRIANNGNYAYLTGPFTFGSFNSVMVGNVDSTDSIRVPNELDGTTIERISSVRISEDGSHVFFLSRTFTVEDGIRNLLYIYEVENSTLRLLRSSEGALFSVTSFQPIGALGGDFYFTTRAANVTQEALPSSYRLYKYNESNDISTVVFEIEDNLNLTLIDITINKLLVSSTSALDSSICRSHSFLRQMYLYDLATEEFSHVPLGEQNTDGCYQDSIFDAVLSNSGQFVLARANEFEIARYDAVEDETDFIQVPDYIRVARINDITTNGSFITFEGDIRTPTRFVNTDNRLWLYDVDASSTNLISINSDLKASFTRDGNSRSGLFSVDDNYVTYATSDDNIPIEILFIDPSQISKVPLEDGLNISSDNETLGQISLNWPENEADHYLIYRSISGVENSEVFINFVQDDTSYTDANSGLDVNDSYIYNILSCTAFHVCTDNLSNEINVFAPGIATGLAEVDEFTTGFRKEIKWDPVEGANSYIVTYESNFQSPSSRSVTTNSYTHLFSNGLPAQLRVMACASGVCGEFSEPLVVTPNIVDSTISNLRYFLNDALNEVTIRWNKAVFADHYNIYEVLPSHDTILRRRTTSPVFVDESINSQTDRAITYRVEICDENNICRGTRDIQVSLDIADSKPSISVSAQANFIQISSLRNEWESVTLFRRTEKFGEGSIIDSQDIGIGADYFYADTSAIAEETYFYYIEGCTNGICELSRDVRFSGLTSYEIGIAKVLTLSASSNEYSNHIELNWTLDEGRISRFKIYRDDRLIREVDGTTTSYRDFSINQSTTHEYYITPVLTANGRTVEGVSSDRVLGSTAFGVGELFQLSSIEGITSLERFYDRIQITWNSLEFEGFTYEVFFSDSENAEFSRITSTRANSYTLHNLAPGTSMFFKIRACNRAECGDFGEAFEGRTSNVDVAPESLTSITNLALNANHDIKVTIADLAEATHYRITRREGSTLSSNERIFFTESTTYTDTVSNGYDSNRRISYFYRVQACNAAGCSTPSEFESIVRTPSLSQIQYRLSSVNAFSDRFDIRITNNTTTLGVNVNIYTSPSEQGERTLIHTIPNANNSWINRDFTEAEQGQQYYFWVETCYEGICTFSEVFLVSELLGDNVAEIPPAPSDITVIDNIDIDRVFVTDYFVPAGVQMNVFSSESVDGDKTRVATITNFSSLPANRQINLPVSNYTPGNYLLWAQFCDGGLCSEFSEPTEATVLPLHTTSIGLNNDESLWNQSPITFAARTALQLGRFGNDVKSDQKLSLGSSASVSFDFYIPSDSSSSTSNNTCESLYRANFELVDDNVNTSLVEIYRGNNSNACRTLGFDDARLLYFVLGGDTSNASTASVLGENGTWKNVNLDISNGFTVSASYEGENLSTLNNRTLQVLRPEFISLHFSQGGGFNSSTTYISNINAQSAFEFNTNRPNPVNVHSVSSHNNEVRISSNTGSEISGAIDVRLYPVADNKILSQPLVVSSEETSIRQIVSPSSGHIYVTVKRCDGNRCSSIESRVVFVRDFIEAPRITASAEGSTVTINWNEIEDATFYQVTGIGRLARVFETDSTTFIINDADSTSYSVRVVACKAGVCSRSSNTVRLTIFVDTDGDGLSDFEERRYGTDPRRADTDGDGISDREEIEELGTNALNRDTDGDGINDNIEIARGTDPLTNEDCLGFLCGSKYKGWRLAELKSLQ
jgi:hypothetical protein